MSFFLMAATVAYALSPQQNDGDQSRPVANNGGSISGIIFIYRTKPAHLVRN
jgi:hypothetical protein